jgi:hypothetical protein
MAAVVERSSREIPVGRLGLLSLSYKISIDKNSTYFSILKDIEKVCGKPMKNQIVRAHKMKKIESIMFPDREALDIYCPIEISCWFMIGGVVRLIEGKKSSDEEGKKVYYNQEECPKISEAVYNAHSLTFQLIR